MRNAGLGSVKCVFLMSRAGDALLPDQYVRAFSQNVRGLNNSQSEMGRDSWQHAQC